MSKNTELYNILGVSPDATDEEIKAAYRKLSKTHHPDKGGDKEMFQKITNANVILRDPVKRKMYDTTGATNTHDALTALGKFREGLINPDRMEDFFKMGLDYLNDTKTGIKRHKDRFQKAIAKMDGYRKVLDDQPKKFNRVDLIMDAYYSGVNKMMAGLIVDEKLCDELMQEYTEVMQILEIPTVVEPPSRGFHHFNPSMFTTSSGV